jgi:hypothetical protein
VLGVRQDRRAGGLRRLAAIEPREAPVKGVEVVLIVLAGRHA